MRRGGGILNFGCWMLDVEFWNHSHPTEKAWRFPSPDFTGLGRAFRADGDCDFFEEMNIQYPISNDEGSNSSVESARKNNER